MTTTASIQFFVTGFQSMQLQRCGSSRTCQTAHRRSQPAALNQLQLSYTAVFLEGAALGPVQIIAYKEDVAYKSCSTDTESTITSLQTTYFHRKRKLLDQRLMLTASLTDLQSWCMSRRLQLNAAKTELVWFGSQQSRWKDSPYTPGRGASCMLRGLMLRNEAGR